MPIGLTFWEISSVRLWCPEARRTRKISQKSARDAFCWTKWNDWRVDYKITTSIGKPQYNDCRAVVIRAEARRIVKTSEKSARDAFGNSKWLYSWLFQKIRIALWWYAPRQGALGTFLKSQFATHFAPQYKMTVWIDYRVDRKMASSIGKHTSNVELPVSYSIVGIRAEARWTGKNTQKCARDEFCCMMSVELHFLDVRCP